MSPARLAVALIALAALLPARAHDFVGANLNGIADFTRNHEFVDLMKSSRRFGTATNPFDTPDPPLPLAPDGWPSGDFGVTVFAAQDGVIGMPGSVFKVVFNGQATVLVAAGGTISNVAYTPGTNTTTLDYTFDGGAETMALRFQSVPPGNPVKNLKVIRPGFDPASHPTFTPAWLAHVSRFRVLRMMDWMRTNHEANQIVTWADRPTLEKKKTEADGARIETIVELANTVNRDIWVNIPVRANDEYVTNLAIQLRDTLNPGINVWVEYSNELWNAAFEQFQIQKDLAIAEVGANPTGPLRFDLSNDENQWAFRRVGKRLKEISDIFKAVWGTPAFNARVRPILAGQQANTFIVEQGLEVVDVGLNVRPNTVFYAISGAPYIFPSATNDANEDEVPGLTAQQILDKIGQGVANAPNADSYQYGGHVGLGAWYGLKVVAYEGGFDTFGGQNIPAKRLANLDPQIGTHCRNLLDTWHAQGFEHFVWFNAGADNYNIPFGQWPLLEDMSDAAKPKNQCIDQVLASPLPALTAGVAISAPIAGGNFVGSGNPTGSITNTSGPFGFPGFAQYLLRVPAAGDYRLVFTVENSSGPSIGVQLNGAIVNANFALPETTTPAQSAPLTLTLRAGVNAMRFTRPASAGSWTIPSFTITAVAPAVARPRDADGNGTSDIFWRDPDGQAALWLMNGTAIAGSALLLGPSTGWTALHNADFNNDGRADILWQHTSGMVALWLLDGTTVIGSGVLLGPSTGWSVTHAADFNGDGRADILWRHASGQVAMWLMDGLAVLDSGIIFGSPDWQVTHTPDLNGDGRADLVFRNDGTSQTAAWLMNGLAATETGFIAGNPAVTHTGDFNGDGRRDLVVLGAGNEVAIHLMDGLATTANLTVFGGGAFALQHVADFNGDNRSDLLFMDAGGQVAMWLLDGFSVIDSAIIFGGGAGWTVTHTGDYDGNGTSDLLWKDAGGQVALWTMQGTIPQVAALVFGGNGGWVASP